MDKLLVKLEVWMLKTLLLLLAATAVCQLLIYHTPIARWLVLLERLQGSLYAVGGLW